MGRKQNYNRTQTDRRDYGWGKYSGDADGDKMWG